MDLSMTIVGRGSYPPIFWRLSMDFLSPIFHPLSYPSPPTSTLITLFFCLVSLAEWVIALIFMCYFTLWYYGSTHVEPWYFSIRRILQQSVRFTKVWNIICLLCWYSDLISHTHTTTHSTYWGQYYDTPIKPCKYIFNSTCYLIATGICIT